MADVIRLSFNSLRFSSSCSLLTSLNSLHPNTNQRLFKKIVSVAVNSSNSSAFEFVPPFSIIPRKDLPSFKVRFDLCMHFCCYICMFCCNFSMFLCIKRRGVKENDFLGFEIGYDNDMVFEWIG